MLCLSLSLSLTILPLHHSLISILSLSLSLSLLFSFLCDVDKRRTKYAGIFTLLSYTVCPSLLSILGRRTMIESDLVSDTHFKSTFSHPAWAWALLGMSTALILGVAVGPFLPGGGGS
jgi:hypothetical protein